MIKKIIIMIITVSFFYGCVINDKLKDKTFEVNFIVEGSSTIKEIKKNNLIKDIDVPIKEGHNFIGWYKKDTDVKWDLSKDKVSEDITLEARFEIAKYEVKFISDNTELKSYSLTYNSLITDVPEDPIKLGYNFIGWYTDLDSNSTWVFENDLVKEDVTLYAKFSKGITYTVEFRNGNSIYKTYVVNENEKVIKPDNPKKDNSIFIDWIIDNTSFDFNQNITENIQVYAKYRELDIELNFVGDYLDYLIDKSKDKNAYYWNKEGKLKSSSHYVDGVMFDALLNISEATNNATYLNFVKTETDKYVKYNNGKISAFGLSSENTHLDHLCKGNSLFRLFYRYGENKYKDGAKYYYSTITNNNYERITVDGKKANFWHKDNYPNQVWLDGLYMIMPLYARGIILFENDNDFSDIINQYRNVRKFMYNEETGLYHHGYDAKHGTSEAQYWSDDETGLSANVWSRALGWYIMSLVEVIEILPDGEDKEYLKTLLVESIHGVVQYLDEDTKMIYQVVDRTSESDIAQGNYLETSGSAMVAYAILKGVRLDLLDDLYLNIGIEMFEGITSSKLSKTGDEYELKDICKVAGLDTRPKGSVGGRDGSFDYYVKRTEISSDEGKGSAPYMLAYSEILRLV